MPTLTSLSPNSKPAGSPGFWMTCNGTGYHIFQTFDDPTVYWNGQPLETNPISGTQCEAFIPDVLLAAAGTASVHIEMAAGISGSLTFTITASLPTLTSITPTAPAPGATFQVVATGTNFVGTSVIRIDGVDQATTFISPTELRTTSTTVTFASAAVHQVTVNTPGVGATAGQALTVTNAVPTISALAPNAKVVGAAAFTLTITGTGFSPPDPTWLLLGVGAVGTRGAWNGQFRTTRYISPTSIEVDILASDLSSAGTPVIAAVNDPPGGGTARTDQAPNIVAFTISNPVPHVDSVTPASLTSGGGPTDLTINGSGFVGGAGASAVVWDGTALATRYLTPGTLAITLTAAMLAAGAVHTLKVTNGGPGGGDSNTVNFTVSSSVPLVSYLSPASLTVGAPSYTVDIVGSGFLAGCTVRIDLGGNLPSGQVQFINSTLVRVTILAANLNPYGPDAQAGSHIVNVTNPGPVISRNVDLPVVNPLPTLTALSSTTKLVGADPFILTLTGTNFLTGVSVVKVGGASRPTTFVSGTSLQVQITAADLSSARVLQVTVANPAPGGGETAGRALSVNNAVAAITSMSPNTSAAPNGSGTELPIILTVQGTGFLAGSVIVFGGTVLATTLTASGTLQASVSAALRTATGAINVLVRNPAPGGGDSATSPFTVVNPQPVLQTLAPSHVNAGTAGQVVTINGYGFLSGGHSAAFWNGAARTTVYVSQTQLTIALTVGDLTAATTGAVTVVNDGPGGGASNPLAFIVGAVNALATVTSLTPATANMGGVAPVVRIVGTNFLAGSIAEWEGQARPTAYVSPTALDMTLSAADMAVPGVFEVSVFTPAPGGGNSNTLPFTVVAQNPVPTVTDISPASVVAGHATFTLTINGRDFVDGCTANADLSSGTHHDGLAVTFVSSTQVTVSIPNTYVAAALTIAISVMNPAPGGGTSGAVTLTVYVGTSNPVPTVDDLSPKSSTVGAGAVTVDITGAGFIATSVAKFAGATRTTTYVSATHIQIALVSGDNSVAGDFAITVTNPGPGGGTSPTARTYSVTAPSNPIPRLDSLSPATILRGAADFVMGLFGARFVSSSVARFNGANKATTFKSSARLDATIPAADVAVLPGGLAVWDPTAHSEAESHNAQVVRALSRGTVFAPAITGPDPTAGQIHPEDGVLAWVAGGAERARISEDGLAADVAAVRALALGTAYDGTPAWAGVTLTLGLNRVMFRLGVPGAATAINGDVWINMDPANVTANTTLWIYANGAWSHVI